ncbi:MAG: SURF1 family protein [Asticcacaulis sp.]|uniref:SURF1 family protein n=1 Tax=Asticcacaulis sp. TaxID=1872648 RepID=UPI0039E57582
MSFRDYLKAVPPGLAIASAIAFILLNGLGIWQLERLKWKEGLIADMARTEAAAPLPVETLLAQPKPDWRSAALPDCVIDPAQLIYMHSEVAGVPGYRVLTACPIKAGAMLVDLGFAENRQAVSAVTLAPVGRLRPFEKSGLFTPVNRIADNDWYWRSATEMGTALKASLRPDYFLVLDLKASRADIAGLLQGPLTAPLPNRHLEYALTWFGLGWALLGVFGSVVYQRARKAKTI